MIEIKHKISGITLYSSQTARGVREAVAEAASSHTVSLRGADLRGAALGGLDLRGLDLRDADLTEAMLNGTNLRGTDLRGAELVGIALSGANTCGCVASVHFFTAAGIGHRGGVMITYCPEMDVLWCDSYEGTLSDFEAHVENQYRDNARHLASFRAAIAYLKDCVTGYLGMPNEEAPKVARAQNVNVVNQPAPMGEAAAGHDLILFSLTMNKDELLRHMTSGFQALTPPGCARFELTEIQPLGSLVFQVQGRMTMTGGSDKQRCSQEIPADLHARIMRRAAGLRTP